jgi:hypothetical protein
VLPTLVLFSFALPTKSMKPPTSKCLPNISRSIVVKASFLRCFATLHTPHFLLMLDVLPMLNVVLVLDVLPLLDALPLMVVLPQLDFAAWPLASSIWWPP